MKNRKPLQVNYYYFDKIKSWIDENHLNYDMFFCNHIRTTEYVKSYKDKVKIVDFVDSIAMNYEKAIGKSKGLWKLIYGIDKKRLKDYEVSISNIFQKAIITSKVDSDFIKKMGGKNVEVIGHYISKKVNSNLDMIKKEEGTICFLGKMDYEPNVTATIHFVKNIYPKLKNIYPNLKFYVIGGSPTEEIKPLS